MGLWWMVSVSVFVVSITSGYRTPLRIYHEEWRREGAMHRVCYYAIPRARSGDITVKPLAVGDIDPHLCTHIIVAFAYIRDGGIKPGNETDVQLYQDVVRLKEQNPELKVLLSLGGGSTDGGFPSLVRDPQAVVQFATTARNFLVQYGFDGLDLDWEFPAWPVLSSDRREKRWFLFLVQQLFKSFKATSSPELLLTIAVAAPKTIVDRSYAVKALAQYVDLVCVMGYDFHIFWPYLPFTGHNAPLLKRRIEKFYFATMNTAWAMRYWEQRGMPKEKLVVGVPTYGRTWKLVTASWAGVGAAAVGPGMSSGVVSYPEACMFVQQGATRHFDEDARVPYATRERDWVSYDDPQSIYEKAKWARDNQYGGVMTWNLNSDDWAGVCSGAKFPLHNAIRDVLV